MDAGRAVWVTRAEPGAAATSARLSALGFHPLISPLLAVRTLDTPLSLEGVGSLAFTSTNGVLAFAGRTGRRNFRVFTVGDATAEAARDTGFEAVASADGDGTDLVRLILNAAPQGLVLCAGPRQPAGDVPGDLRRVGIAAKPLALYETLAATDLPEPVRTALTKGAIGAVLIHSARAGEAFARLARPFDLTRTAAVGLSPGCLQPLESLALGDRMVAEAPREDALLDALGKALRPR